MSTFESPRSLRVQPPPDAQRPLLRWLPFLVAATLSLVIAAQAPDGRHAFSIDWSLGRYALFVSMTKAPHIGAGAVLALFAMLATGRERWHIAFLLTMLVGAGWELCQATVVGRTARVSDLAPDVVGALIGCSVGMLGLRIRDWAALRLAQR